ncbi:MAG: transcriptional repressor LexA [Phycisphaerae bacterium]|nr:transcriptional repressor LexA [Phycisphaerae bacterium]
MPIKANPKLTPRQIELLRIIVNYHRSQCYLPTIAELAAQTEISRSTVFEHIAQLQKKGFLSEAQGKARSLSPTSKALNLLKKLEPKISGDDFTASDSIPLAGRVAAGSPIEAIEDCRTLSLTDSFSGDDVFALQVAGDSMIDADIQDGDTVICKKAVAARDGQLVVAIVDDDNATLKRFFKEKDRVRLQPENKNYQPIYTQNCRIEGVVLGLVRKF